MKYIVLKPFTDKYDLSKKYIKGDLIDITKKRADEILEVDSLIAKYIEEHETGNEEHETGNEEPEKENEE